MNRHGGAKNAKYAASRLAMTEQAYFHSVSQQKAFGKLDVEEFEIVAAIDNHTSEICREMDGKVFLTRDFEPGLNANPFHPNCHCTTVPSFDGFNEGEMRFARDEDGKRYYVPSDMKYNEWKEKFVGGGEKSEIVNSLEKDVEKSLDKTAKSGIMELGSKFLNKNDPLYKNADKIKPVEGFDDIVFHGDSSHLIAYGYDGEEWLYGAKEAAEMIRNSKSFHNQPIRLLSCRAGANKDGIAQQIADQLGVEVLAPSETLFVDINGDMFISNNEELAQIWNISSPEDRQKIHQTGEWVLFKPNRR